MAAARPLNTALDRMSAGNKHASREEAEASRLVAKANARMSRIENSVRDELKSGYVRNVYGDYYRPAALEEVLGLLAQAGRIHPLQGYALYLRAGYLHWAGRLAESAEAYEQVLASYPNYSRPAMAMLAGVYGRLGRLDLAHELVERHNTTLRAENLPLPLLTIEKLNLGGS